MITHHSPKASVLPAPFPKMNRSLGSELWEEWGPCSTADHSSVWRPGAAGLLAAHPSIRSSPPPSNDGVTCNEPCVPIFRMQNVRLRETGWPSRELGSWMERALESCQSSSPASRDPKICASCQQCPQTQSPGPLCSSQENTMLFIHLFFIKKHFQHQQLGDIM